MRVGFNPNKDKVLPKSDYTHQVIVPVYIPHQNDYFKDSFQIVQLGLEALFKTCHDKTYSTISKWKLYLNPFFYVKNLNRLHH